MFIVVKKKTLITAVVILAAIISVIVACGVCSSAKKTASMGQKIIVIDAGHGGNDKGVIGKNGTAEADKNLQIAELLKEKLEEGGFFVVMTRTTANGAKETGSFKKEDFERRKKIVEKYRPDALVSVHCNKFPTSDRRGAQVFYNKMSKEGKNFASVLQNSLNGLNSVYTGRAYSHLEGDYYMLNITEKPSAIVECGFLSNEEDEKLLADEEYLDEFVYALYDGIVAYFEG